jgi:hypothetical protein
MPKRITDIAAEMRADLADQPFSCTRPVRLGGGLELLLHRNGPQYRLSLRREGVYPSEQEVGICAAAFGVAEGSEPGRRVQNDLLAGWKRQLHVVDLVWRELEEH